jgi:hypothetical protein
VYIFGSQYFSACDVAVGWLRPWWKVETVEGLIIFLSYAKKIDTWHYYNDEKLKTKWKITPIFFKNSIPIEINKCFSSSAIWE